MIASAAPQNPSPNTGKPRFNRQPLILLVLVIIGASVLIVFATAFLIGPAVSVTKTSFTPYTTPVSHNSPLTIVNANGGVSVSTWTKNYLMINGTISARGIGANPAAVSFIESNSSGEILFQTIAPPGTFFFTTGYTVDINVYAPSSATFGATEVTTANGNIEVSGINASNATLIVTNGQLTVSSLSVQNLVLTDTNGNVGITCSSSCASVTATATNGGITANLTSLSLNGPYTLRTTDGSINLSLPKTSGFDMTATTTETISTSGGLTVLNGQPLRYGAGTAVITLTAIQGSLSIEIV
jgi:DUF4097 and DUF4098 domain-containing protein YvlB